MTFMDSVVQGLATGLGAAIGTWLAQRGILKHLEKLERQVRKAVNHG